MPIEYDPDRSDYNIGHEVFVQTETGEYMDGRLVDRESRFFSYAIFKGPIYLLDPNSRTSYKGA